MYWAGARRLDHTQRYLRFNRGGLGVVVTYGVPGIGPGSAVFKASTLPTILSLRPCFHLGITLNSAQGFPVSWLYALKVNFGGAWETISSAEDQPKADHVQKEYFYL